MEDRLLRHYRLELDFLRQLGIEFAEHHPDIAGHLGLPFQTGMDPHVERLREGFALLTARIRAKIEDEHPELTEALLGALQAPFTRPIPSMSVVAFDVADDKAAPLAKGPAIEAGAVLKSQPIADEPACEFRTTYPVTLWPLRVGVPRLGMQLEPGDAPGTGATAILTVPVDCVGGATLGQLDPNAFGTLRFYLDGEGRAPFLLRDRLIHDVVRIEVRETTKKPEPASFVLAVREAQVRRVLRPVGFGEDEGVLPRPGRSPLGYRNLREFFAFPQKYLFFDLDRLDGVIPWGKANGFEIRFFLRRPPDPGVVVRKESLRLFCTPIVNLFRRSCRVDRDDRRVEYPVEVPEARTVAHREFFEIVSIDSVQSAAREYTRYDDLQPRPTPGRRSYWSSRRRASTREDSKRTHVLISFVDEAMEAGPPEDPTVTIEATCTNLDLPAQLPSLDLRLQRVAPTKNPRSIVPMTRAYPPPPANETHWRLISMLALNHLPIGDPPPAPGRPRADGRGTEALREILRLHDPIRDETTRRQVESIRHVESRHEFRALPHDRRAIVGGVCVTIEFGEDAFSQRGLLLAEVLEQFLGLYASLNAFTRLVARVGEEKVKEWGPRAGEKILL